MEIILISGKAEAGKSTTAKYILRTLRENGLRAAMASYGDYVKGSARMLWGWNGQKDVAGRSLLTWWGTDVVRKEDQTFWARSLVGLARFCPEHLDYFIVDDVRFANEITIWDKEPYDKLTIRVERSNHENILTEEQRAHVSEVDLDNWDFNIYLIAENLRALELAIKVKVFPLLPVTVMGSIEG